MSLCLAMLSWKSPLTLGNTLLSYLERGLLDLADQRQIFLQEPEDRQLEWCNKLGLEVIMSEENVGLGPGFGRLIQECRCDHFLFLEEDWQLIEDAAVTARRIRAGLQLLNSDPLGAVRYRHRRQYGDPLFSLQFKGRELDQPACLGDCIFWRENPELDYPNHIRKTFGGEEPFFVLSSKYSGFTNNPVMYHSDFLRSHLPPFCTGNLEDQVQPWWQQQDFHVYHGEGLFKHNRLDR